MLVFNQKINTFTTDLTNIYEDYVASKGDYTTGNKVTYKGMYYEVIPSSVPLNYYPDLYPLYFKKIGVANKESITDLRSTTKSSKSGGFYIKFPISYTNDVMAIGYFSAYRLKVEALDSEDNVIRTFYNETQSINENVFDYYDYIYSEYTAETDRTVFLKLTPIGVNMKVTFDGGTGFSTPNCGFVMYGQGINIGETLYGVNFKYNSYSTRTTDEFGVMTINKRGVQNVTDFVTTIERGTFLEVRNKIAKLYDEFCCFVLDDTKTDAYSFAGIGVINDISMLYDEYDKSMVNFSVLEAI